LWSKNAIESEDELRNKVNATLEEFEGVPEDILDGLKNVSGNSNMK
jgi:hypothetical protein